jgi:hypothetical protein
MPADPRPIATAALAAALLALPLLLAQHAARLPLAFPLELPLLLLLLLGAPAALRAPLRLAATLALAALLTLALLDLATAAALNRRFNPLFDLPLAADAWRLTSGSLGTPVALAAAAALAGGVALAAAALWWAAGRLTARPRPALLALAVPIAALAALDTASEPRAFDPPGTAAASRLAGAHLADAWRARGDLARFRAEAAADGWASAPAEAILPALRNRDVLVIFVESYGRSAHANPLYAPTVTAALAEAEARLETVGLAARSAWLTSPVVGGQSWLAHATLLSGLAIDNEARYRALLASPRRTLLHLAQGAGWRTAAVMPAITLPWPEAGWFGYDAVLAAKDLGYAGRPFNWVTMPDQFTLASLERRLLGSAPRPPVFAEVALISSHAPWTPIPPLLPWETLGDGRIFDRFATAGDPPEVVWRDPGRVREQYRQALGYTLGVVAAFAERRAATRPLVIVVGDHQPAPLVSGDPEGRDVPVHLIGPPEFLTAFDAGGWSPGLLPSTEAPVLPMQDFRDRLLAGFAAPSPARQAALGQPLPPAPGR